MAKAGSGTNLTSCLIFEKLGIKPELTTYDQVALYERLRSGELKAAIYVAGRLERAISEVRRLARAPRPTDASALWASTGEEADRAPTRGAGALARGSLVLPGKRWLTEALRTRDVDGGANGFPQTQFPGHNDGPRFMRRLEGEAGLLRRAGPHERAAYKAMERAAPDLVLKLELLAELALRRKPDTPPAQLRRKVEVVRALRYPPDTRVVAVAALQPFQQVILHVKRAVWEAL